MKNISSTCNEIYSLNAVFYAQPFAVNLFGILFCSSNPGGETHSHT